ncbi:hypothetical protein [Marinomonas algicola]|uniref:hypothetical protein n=1 Tax=Marinomonas algicola TaxID=2773454 RepID=UPI00174D5BB6|nr:hypothetical protein [Marinomonas algicola]
MLTAGIIFDAVIANNDEITIRAMKAGDLDATAQGKEAMQTRLKLMKGEEVD